MKKIEIHHLIIIALLVMCAILLIQVNSSTRTFPQKENIPENKATSGKEQSGMGTSNPAYEIIMRRKSVRQYTDETISKEILEKIVRAGMASPTAGNKQPWSFVVITDRTKLNKLADKLEYAKMLHDAPAAIAVCGVPAWGLEGEANEYWVQDCSAVSENILLAVESMNLGAVWTGVYPIKEREKDVREILEIPDDVVPLNVIAIGHPAGNPQPKDKFKPERIHWEKW